MRIYRLDPPKDCNWITAEQRGLLDLGADTPSGDAWTPVPVRLSTQDDAGRHDGPTYFPWYSQCHLILRDVAIDRVAPALAEYGEILPLDYPGGRMATFNCLTRSAALDVEKSEVAWFSPGRVMYVRSFAFVPEKLVGHKVFKLEQWPSGPLLLTDAMVDEFERAGLGRMEFFALWDSEHGPYHRAAHGQVIPEDRRV